MDNVVLTRVASERRYPLLLLTADLRLDFRRLCHADGAGAIGASAATPRRLLVEAIEAGHGGGGDHDTRRGLGGHFEVLHRALQGAVATVVFTAAHFHYLLFAANLYSRLAAPQKGHINYT